MAVKKLADIRPVSLEPLKGRNEELTLANQGLISSIWFLASIQKMKR